VDALEFYDNGLDGRIPGPVGTLTHLERLDLIQNKLSGVLPTPLIRRWLSGAPFIAAEVSLFTSVSEIDFEDRPSALLCARRRISLSVLDGTFPTSARQSSESCTEVTSHDFHQRKLLDRLAQIVFPAQQRFRSVARGAQSLAR
jgi:hypothetical protein